MPSFDDLETEIVAIGDLPREELGREWQQIYGHPPPKGLHHQFLARAVCWHLQAKRLGGLPVGTRQQLRSLMEQAGRKSETAKARGNRRTAQIGGVGNVGTAATEGAEHARASVATGPSDIVSEPARRPRRRLSPGARLIREWNGRAHVVDVIDRGFVYDGKLHASLTAIAFTITGARWSGPRFFGL